MSAGQESMVQDFLLYRVAIAFPIMEASHVTNLATILSIDLRDNVLLHSFVRFVHEKNFLKILFSFYVANRTMKRKCNEILQWNVRVHLL